MAKAEGNPPVEPELSTPPLSRPPMFTDRSLLLGYDLFLVERRDVLLGSALADHPLFTVGKRLSAGRP